MWCFSPEFCQCMNLINGAFDVIIWSIYFWCDLDFVLHCEMCFYWLCFIIVVWVLYGLNSKGQAWLACDFHIKVLLNSSLLGRIIVFIFMYCLFTESRLEGWLSLPVRNNTKKFGWVKKVISTFECCSFSFRFNYSHFPSGVVEWTCLHVQTHKTCLCFLVWVDVTCFLCKRLTLWVISKMGSEVINRSLFFWCFCVPWETPPDVIERPLILDTCVTMAVHVWSGWCDSMCRFQILK